MLFVTRCEHIGVDQVDLFLGRGRDQVSSEPAHDAPKRLASKRQHLRHGINGDVVVKDPEREAICDRSGDSQLADGRWAVEEQKTERCGRGGGVLRRHADVGQCSRMIPELI